MKLVYNLIYFIAMTIITIARLAIVAIVMAIKAVIFMAALIGTLQGGLVVLLIKEVKKISKKAKDSVK